MIDLEKLASEIAECANSCCSRDDGFEEYIFGVALDALKKAHDDGKETALGSSQPPQQLIGANQND